MTKKHTPALNEKERLRLRQIKTRHEGAESLARWTSSEAALKERVIVELEQMQREAGQDAELAAGLMLVLEVLDVLSVEGAAGMGDAAREDVRWLLERVAL